MMPWFVWNNKNSSAMGLWISKLPKITRAEERYDTVEVPGRAGSLIMLEGEDVYESYMKECTVQTRRNNPLMQEILDWLRGDGELVFSNEIGFMYNGRIAAAVSFDRISNDLAQAKIPFFVEPFKMHRYPDKDKITFSANGTIINPGNVSSKPKVKVTCTGTVAITIGGETMTFYSMAGTIIIDCDARIITAGGNIWGGTSSGEFWTIPVGRSSITISGASATVEIEPNWRWV